MLQHSAILCNINRCKYQMVAASIKQKLYKFMKITINPLCFCFKKACKTILIMKISILLLTICSFQISASLYSQTTFDLSFNEITVKELLKTIEQQSEFRFFYNDDIFDVSRKVSVNVHDYKVDDILELLFAKNELSFRILDNNLIVITPTISLQQQSIVRGKITDSATGEPLAGVTVQVKGTQTGSISNADGTYTVSLPSSSNVLIFSFVGFVTQEIDVAGRNSIDVIMLESVTSLEEVVVVGYGTQAKKDITGSVAVINADDMLATPSASFTGQLQGRAAGIMIGTSGAPGSESTIRIRGVGSVNDNSPLFVIDGVSTRDQDMSSINPNDIESIQILKDASAASIYGAQAANGVIIITTKKGTTTGQTRMTYEGYYGIQKIGKGYDMLNSEEWMESEFQMQSNAYALRGLSLQPSHPQFGTGTFTLPDYLIPTRANEGDPNTTIDSYNIATNRITKTEKIGTDWLDQVTQVAPMQNHQLSLLGGSEKGTFAMSLNYFHQDGTVKFSYFDRYSIRANSQFYLRPGIRFGENLTITHSKFNNRGSEADVVDGSIGRAVLTTPFLPVYDIAGNYAGNKAQGSGATSNIYAELERDKDNYNKNFRILGNIYAEIDLLKSLTFKTNYGIDYGNLASLNMSRLEPWTTNTNPTTLTEATSGNIRWVYSNTLTFKRTLGQSHDFTVLLGTEAIKDGIGRSLSGSRQQFLFEDDTNTWVLNAGSDGTATNSATFNGEVTFFSLFGRVDYILSNKYMVSATVRRDGSSKFSEENRYGTFPALSLGWRMSEEEFMKNISWITNLKWRVGYGTTGNSEIPSKYNWANQYNTSFGDTYYDYTNNQRGTSGYRLSAYGNIKTKWETTKMLNIGLDASFFRQGLEITVDYFIKNTSDMLIPAQYSALSGDAQAPYINYGSIRNKGIEFAVTHRNNIGGDWNYDLNLNFTAYTNEILQLSENDEAAIYGTQTGLGNITVSKKGQPIGMYYGYNVLGFYNSPEDVINYKTEGGETILPYGVASLASLNSNAWVGKYKFEDVDGSGRIDGGDLGIIGNPHPDFTTSLNAAINFRNLDLSMYWYATVGHEIFRLWKQRTDYFAEVGGRSKDALYDSWTPENHDASSPILDSQDPVTGKSSHSGYIENGSFLKLKSLSVGYTLPNKGLIQRINATNVRIYLQGANLLTLTKYKGLDPEITNQSVSATGDILRGIDNGYWPAPRQFIVGITLGF